MWQCPHFSTFMFNLPRWVAIAIGHQCFRLLELWKFAANRWLHTQSNLNWWLHTHANLVQLLRLPIWKSRLLLPGWFWIACRPSENCQTWFVFALTRNEQSQFVMMILMKTTMMMIPSNPLKSVFFEPLCVVASLKKWWSILLAPLSLLGEAVRLITLNLMNFDGKSGFLLLESTRWHFSQSMWQPFTSFEFLLTRIYLVCFQLFA